MTQSEFCTVQTLEENQPIIGTASSNTSVWFLLEVPQPWAAKALAENHLPEDINALLAEWVETTPHSRLVFIKKDNRPVDSPILYIAISADSDQRLYQFNLQADYSDLSLINPADLISQQSQAGLLVDPDPLYLVCTNGKRDNCCSKFGLPVIQAFIDDGESHVWQCTHLGGHKFAAVVGVYPAGLYYQLFDTATIAPFRQAINAKQVPLNGLRGRTAYPGAAQAAEYFLRQQSGNLDLDAYTLQSAENQDDHWQVTFKNGVAHHTVSLVQSLSQPAISGCNGKLKPSPRYQLISIS